MKQLLLVLIIVLALAACSGGGTAPARPGAGPDPGTGGANATGCAREIAIRCASGVDGCIGGKTTEHVCVPDDARPGPACELELAMVCPEGQIDGCLKSPPVSASHICVYN